MPDYLAPMGVPLKPFGFGNFGGMTTSRDRNAMDTGDKQTMWLTKNCQANWNGLIVRDPGYIRESYAENRQPVEINFYGIGNAVWAEDTGGDIDLVSDEGIRLVSAFTRNSHVSSTVFAGRTYFMSAGQDMQYYNGAVYNKSSSPTAPQGGFCCVIARRLVVAGMPDKPSEIWFSRADDGDVWPLDEAGDSVDVLRAVFLDIRNVIGTADLITGIAQFEQDRLAIFTQNKVIIYAITPDMSIDSSGNASWQIDDRSSINIGCVAHNSIISVNVPQSMGATLLYVSRSGIYKLERVGMTGTIIYANPVSNSVVDLVRSYVDQTPDVFRINGFYDADNNLANFLFPTAQGFKRLTFAIPMDQNQPERWSVGDHLNMSCGNQLGGYTLVGGKGGVYRQARMFQYMTDSIALENKVELPEMVAETPLLWHGDLVNKKETMMFVMQAAGHGEVVVEAFDELDRELCSMTFPLSPERLGRLAGLTVNENTGYFPDLPIDMQFSRKFEFAYRGVWFRFTGRGLGVIRISAFAVFVRLGRK